MENGNVILAKEKARASCHLVRELTSDLILRIQKKMTEHALLLF